MLYCMAATGIGSEASYAAGSGVNVCSSENYGSSDSALLEI